MSEARSTIAFTKLGGLGHSLFNFLTLPTSGPGFVSTTLDRAVTLSVA